MNRCALRFHMAVLCAASATLCGALQGAQPAQNSGEESAAEEESAGGIDDGFNISPTLLEAKDSSGTTLGLEYSVGVKWIRDLGSTGDDTVGPGPLGGSDFRKVQIWRAKFEIGAKGTVAASADKNPENFMTASMDAAALASFPQGTSQFGASGKFGNRPAVQQQAEGLRPRLFLCQAGPAVVEEAYLHFRHHARPR